MKILPAEWERCDAILMALPHADTDWAPLLGDAIACYRDMVNAMADNGETVWLLCRDAAEARALMQAYANVQYIEAEYNDTWTRDYGPITISDQGRLRMLDFGFNGWGLKFAADKDNLVVADLHRRGLLPDDAYSNNLDFVLEGGSIESDGRGTLMTTVRCLTSPNRNGGRTLRYLEDTLRARLGARHIVWLESGALEGDDTDSHIDTLARLAPDNTIVYVYCSDRTDPHYTELQAMQEQIASACDADGRPFRLVALPMAPVLTDPDDGMRLPSTYANYLVTPRNVFMPVYGHADTDLLACDTIARVYPDQKVIPIDCRALVRQHGSLHCSTMQMIFDKI